MRFLRNLERKYIPKTRHKSWYITIKVIVLSIPYIIYTLIDAAVTQIASIKFKRKNKPDIVLANIIDGWSNYLIENPTTEVTAKKRASICASCPNAKFVGGVSTIIVDNKTKEIRGLVCDLCNCPLSAKVRSKNDYCPAGKW